MLTPDEVRTIKGIADTQASSDDRVFVGMTTVEALETVLELACARLVDIGAESSEDDRARYKGACDMVEDLIVSEFGED